MPNSSTFDPDLFDNCISFFRLLLVCSILKPRKASFAPNSKNTISGFLDSKRAGSLVRPPELVSPLMLALNTDHLLPCFCNSCSNSFTQPLPRGRPYSAERLSPKTKMTGLALTQELNVNNRQNRPINVHFSTSLAIRF